MLDVATALVVEVYQELGMKFDEAIADLEGRLADPDSPLPKRAPPPPDDRASMSMLQAMMGGSDFRGPRG